MFVAGGHAGRHTPCTCQLSSSRILVISPASITTIYNTAYALRTHSTADLREQAWGFGGWFLIAGWRRCCFTFVCAVFDDVVKSRARFIMMHTEVSGMHTRVRRNGFVGYCG